VAGAAQRIHHPIALLLGQTRKAFLADERDARIECSQALLNSRLTGEVRTRDQIARPLELDLFSALARLHDGETRTHGRDGRIGFGSIHRAATIPGRWASSHASSRSASSPKSSSVRSAKACRSSPGSSACAGLYFPAGGCKKVCTSSKPPGRS